MTGWADSLGEKNLILGKTEGMRKRRVAEDEMVGWYHGQGSLACYSPWGHKEWDTA